MYRKPLVVALLVFFSSLPIFPNELIDAASGQSHSLLLFDDGRILPYGDNCYGQLGLPKTVDSQPVTERFPLYIEAPIRFVSVAAGIDYSLAIAEDGTLWGWGNNRNNQLGADSPKSTEKPLLLNNLKSWKKVFAGGYESLALKEDGSLWRLRDLEQIQHPKNKKWKSASIFGEVWGWGDYTLIVILQDIDGKFWEYGSCNDISDNLSIINSFISEKSILLNHSDILPLTVPSNTIDFQATDFTGVYKTTNDIVMFGLAVSDGRHRSSFREKAAEMPFYDYLSSITVKKKAKQFKKVVTGNFTDTTTFSIDNFGPKDAVHFYSYSALLQNNGRFVIYTNGKKLVSDRKMKIKNIFGGYAVFAQDRSNQIYVIGYNRNSRLDKNKPEDKFFYFEPLRFERIE